MTVTDVYSGKIEINVKVDIKTCWFAVKTTITNFYFNTLINVETEFDRY